jgi:BirA family biotin operon repressor/biotin-[acetyl-CoA-carboxylase] ligase
MSLLLRPKSSPESTLKITTAMAVAACEAIEAVVDESPGIKWVNDLYLYGKKVAGILAEGALEPDGNALAFAVVGIGINLTPPTMGFPAALTGLAGAVTVNDREDLRERLAAEILSRFFFYYPLLSDEPLYSRYRERLFVLDKQVTVIRNGQQQRATVLDLGKDFRLLLGFSDRETAWVGSEEIRLLPDAESE